MMRARKKRYTKHYSNWQARALACKIRDGMRCVECQVAQYTLLYSRSGKPYIMYLHAAHIHTDDPRRAERDLITLCPSCHRRYDRANSERTDRVHLERMKHQRLLARHSDLSRRCRALALVWATIHRQFLARV